jgi:hypothetical protein
MKASLENLEEGLYAGAYMWKFLGGVFLPIGAPLGNLGRGSVYRDL